MHDAKLHKPEESSFAIHLALFRICRLIFPTFEHVSSKVPPFLCVQVRRDMFLLTGRDFALLNKRDALLHPELCIPGNFWMRPARTVVWGREVSDAMVSVSMRLLQPSIETSVYCSFNSDRKWESVRNRYRSLACDVVLN